MAGGGAMGGSPASGSSVGGAQPSLGSSATPLGVSQSSLGATQTPFSGMGQPAQMPFNMTALSANPMGGAAGTLGGVAAMPPGFQPNFGGMNLPPGENPYISGGFPGNPGFPDPRTVQQTNSSGPFAGAMPGGMMQGLQQQAGIMSPDQMRQLPQFQALEAQQTALGQQRQQLLQGIPEYNQLMQLQQQLNGQSQGNPQFQPSQDQMATMQRLQQQIEQNPQMQAFQQQNMQLAQQYNQLAQPYQQQIPAMDTRYQQTMSNLQSQPIRNQGLALQQQMPAPQALPSRGIGQTGDLQSQPIRNQGLALQQQMPQQMPAGFGGMQRPGMMRQQPMQQGLRGLLQGRGPFRR